MAPLLLQVGLALLLMASAVASYDYSFSTQCTEVGGVESCLRDLTCVDTKFGALRSSSAGGSFALLFEGLGVRCSGVYSSAESAVHEKFNIEFSNCNARLPIHVSGGGFGGASVDSLLECKPEVTVGDRALVPDILTLAGRLLINSLNENKELLSKMAGDGFGFLHGAAAEPPALPADSSFMTWTEEALQFLADLREKYPYDGIKALTTLLTGQTETIPFGMDVEMSWPVSQSCVVRAEFDEISFTGLEAAAAAVSYHAAARPSSSLAIQVPIDSLSLKCPVQLSLQCGDAPPVWTDRMVLHTEFTDVLVSLDIFVAMTRRRLDDLYVDQLMVPECLMQAFDTIHLNDITFDMRLKNYRVSGARGDSYAPIFNDIVQVGVLQFPQVVTELVRGVASGPLKSSVNEYVAKSLGSLQCPEHVPATGSPQYVQFSSGDAKEAIQKTTAQLLSALGIDQSVIAAGNAHFGDFFADVSSKVFGWEPFLEQSYTRLVSLQTSAAEALSRTYDNDSLPLASFGSCLETDGCARLMSRWSTGHTVSGEAISADAIAQFFINIGVVAKLDANKVLNLQYKDILNPDCLLSTFDDVSVTELLTRRSKSGRSALDAALSILPGADLLRALNDGISELLKESESACQASGHEAGWSQALPAVPVSPVRKERQEDCTQQTDPLECAINNIVLGPFEEICVDISTGDELCVDQLTCFDMDMTGIPSGYIPPSSFLIGIESMAVTCRADWSMSGVTGVLDGTIRDFTSSMTLNTRVFESYPISVSVEECAVDSVEVELVFSGGSKIVTALLNSLAGLGEKALEKAITALLCETLDEAIAQGLTTLLEDKVDPWLQEVVQYGPSTPPVLPEDINWHETSIETIHNLIDSINIGGGGGGDVADCLAAAVSKDRSASLERFMDYVAEQVGDIRVPIDQTIVITPNASMYIENLVISGFNTVQSFKLLETSPESNITLLTELELESFAMTVNAVVTIGSYVETVKIDLALRNITLAMDLVLGVNRARWNDLYLDQLIDFNCWQSTVDALSLSSLVVNMILDQVTYIQVRGDAGPLEKDVVTLVDNLFLFLTEGFEDLITDVMAGLFQGPVRASINELLADRLDNRTDCPVHVSSAGMPPDWIVWAESSLIKVADKLFDDLLGAEGLNTFMTCATGGTGAATISVMDGAWVVELTGLNSFYDFTLLLPVENEPYDLYNSIGVGYCPSESACNKFGIDLKGTAKGEPLELQLLLENTKIVLGLFVEMNKNDIGDLQVSTWSHDGCKMSTIDELSLYDFSVTTASCELVVNGGDIYGNITKIVDVLLSILSSPQMVDNINTNLDSTVVNSEYVCTETVNPASVEGSESGKGNTDPTLLIAVCCTAAGILMLMGAHYYCYGHLEDSAWRFLCRQNIIESYFPALWLRYGLESTLMFNQNVPLAVRICTPLFILGTIALFIYSNTVYAVDVMVELDLGNTVTTPPPVFSFSLQNTVEDMWNAKVYPLAILIAFFSGAWPYIKLCTMLAAWVLPPSIMKISFRETSLTALDVLGKWSLIDAYVMVMMMVAFHVELDLADNLAVIITVVSKTGFYTFITASVASLIAGHVVLYYHHYVTEMRTAPAEDFPEAIMDRTFPIVSRGTKVTCTPAGKGFMIVTLLFTGAAIWFGASVETFKFEFRGLVGYLMGIDADAPYSLITVGTTLPEASGKTNDPGTIYLQAAYFMFGVGMPLALITASLVLWVMPLRLKVQQRLFLCAEIFNAWSALDVFVISIVAALLEIQQFAAFIVGDSCDAINEWLEENMDDKLHGDDKCFDVVAVLMDDIWTICLAAFLMVAVCYPVLMMYGHAIDTRLHEIGVRQTFAFRTKSIENDELDEALEATVVQAKSIDRPSVSKVGAGGPKGGMFVSILNGGLDLCAVLRLITEEPLIQ